MLWTVATWVSCGILGAAAVSHLRHRAALENALETHAIWPDKMVTVITGGVIAAEATIGLGALLILSAPQSDALLALLVGATVQYSCYGFYVAYLLRRRTMVPCGCTADDTVVTRTTAIRAGLLAAVSFGAVAGQRLGSVVPDGPPLIAAAVMALVLGALLWYLPAAMATPSSTAVTV